MSIKRIISSIVLAASAVLLAIGGGATYAAPAAETPGLPDETGPTQSADATVEGAAMQAPPLSGFVNIWVDDVDNYNPAVAYNSNHDEYLGVWENDRGAMRDIYAQRVAGDGTLKSWFTVVTNVGKWNYQPDMAYNPVQDEYLIVYTYQVDSSDYDIWARLVKWNGADLGNPRYAEFCINGDSGKQWNPAVTYNSQNNEYLVVYENWWASGLRDIDARRVDKDGNPLGGSSGVNIITGEGQVRHSPDVAYNAARNEYLIAYTYQYSDTDGDIHGRVASANLGTLSSVISINSNTFDQHGAALAAGPDEYLAVWDEGRPSQDRVCICGRRGNGNGTPAASGVFDIACYSGQAHDEPAVAYGDVYGYLVAWRYASVGTTGDDVYGRFVKPGQDAPSDSQFAIDARGDSQIAPALACGTSGDCLVVEADNYSVAPPKDYEIRGRFVLARHVYLPLVLR